MVEEWRTAGRAEFSYPGQEGAVETLRKHGGKTGVELKAKLPKLEIEQSLLQAIKAGNVEVVKQHLAAGTNVNARDSWEGLFCIRRRDGKDKEK